MLRILLNISHVLHIIIVQWPLYIIRKVLVNEKNVLQSFFRGKTVLITGASSGIGKSLSFLLYGLGSNVIITSRTTQSLKLCEEELKSQVSTNQFGNKIITLQLDLEQHTNMDTCVDSLKRQLEENNIDSIDVLLNNAGVSSRGLALDTKMESLNSVMATNFFGPVALTKALLPWMMQTNKKSFIAVVSSVQGKIGIPLRTSYAASKHALQAYFDCLRAEVANKGVSVSIISPGYVKTSLSLNAKTPNGSKHGVMDETTSKGASPDAVAARILLSIVREEKDVILADTKTTAAVMLKSLFPDLLARILQMK
mmetsp:Transcript_11411/g.15701  ORF Transcript_11411/g.15701 Transcript_11411/m.15701 type:complete len:311 (-) Transcript_11411:817-1749(-)